MTCLIVDDNARVRAALQRALRGETRTSNTVEDGIEEASRWQPSVILLDVRFEDGEDGIAAIPRFRLAAPRAQIIVMSGLLNPADEHRALRRYGAYAYESKDDLRLLARLVVGARASVSSSFVATPTPRRSQH